MKITPEDNSVIVNALYTAAERYRECARTTRESDLPKEAKERLAACFDRQAADCSRVVQGLET